MSVNNFTDLITNLNLDTKVLQNPTWNRCSTQQGKFNKVFNL